MYSTNLWIFSSNLAIALSVYSSFLFSFHTFLFSFFLLFWNLHSPLLLISSYSLAMLPLYFLSGEHLGSLVSDYPSLVLCRGTNPQLRFVTDLLQALHSVALHQVISCTKTRPSFASPFSIIHSLLYLIHFLLCLFRFLYFTNTSSLCTLLSVTFDSVLFCCVFLSFIAYLKSEQ